MPEQLWLSLLLLLLLLESSSSLSLSLPPLPTSSHNQAFVSTITTRMSRHNNIDSSSSSTSTSVAEKDILQHQSSLTTNTDDSASVTTILIVLNQPVVLSSSNSSPSLFEHLWHTSSIHICADGGANRLHRVSQTFVPDVIVGDLDSLHDHVRTFYQNQGCRIVLDADQYCNDLDKAIRTAQEYCDISNDDGSTRPRICVYGSFGGRFDQTMASIQALYKWSSLLFEIVLYTEEMSARLLVPGRRHEIRIDSKQEGPSCGLIPIGARCETVWTDGLEWNLNHVAMEFGGLVSTSNIIVKNAVRVECSQALVWTTELRGFGGSD